MLGRSGARAAEITHQLHSPTLGQVGTGTRACRAKGWPSLAACGCSPACGEADDAHDDTTRPPSGRYVMHCRTWARRWASWCV